MSDTQHETDWLKRLGEFGEVKIGVRTPLNGQHVSVFREHVGGNGCAVDMYVHGFGVDAQAAAKAAHKHLIETLREMLAKAGAL